MDLKELLDEIYHNLEVLDHYKLLAGEEVEKLAKTELELRRINKRLEKKIDCLQQRIGLKITEIVVKRG